MPAFGQIQKGNTFNTDYEIGVIPNIEGFMNLTDKEQELDSLFRQVARISESMEDPDSTRQEPMDFKNNRSRVSMEIYRNGKVNPMDSLLKQGFPTTCTCFVMDDTIFIKTFLGFLGGIGVDLKISKNTFQSGMFVYTDDAMPYKSALSDTIAKRAIDPGAKYQYLIMDKQPGFKKGHQLTGLLTITTNPFYEKNNQGNLDKIVLKGNIYFTCKVNTFMGRFR
ncbi:MAG: hypothetical protein U9Q98_12580 [Bacteroidota bacterium]|nr:hypothetical protein [Bacteroidota bacterium]